MFIIYYYFGGGGGWGRELGRSHWKTVYHARPTLALVLVSSLRVRSIRMIRIRFGNPRSLADQSALKEPMNHGKGFIDSIDLLCSEGCQIIDSNPDRLIARYPSISCCAGDIFVRALIISV